MKIKNLLLIKALVSIAFGIPLLAAPAKLLSLLGITLNAGGEFMAREYGGALVGIFFLCWFAKNSDTSKALKAILLFGFFYDLVNFIVSLLAQLSGLFNPLGWAIVAIYFLFTLWFGYFLIAKPDRS